MMYIYKKFNKINLLLQTGSVGLCLAAGTQAYSQDGQLFDADLKNLQPRVAHQEETLADSVVSSSSIAPNVNAPSRAAEQADVKSRSGTPVKTYPPESYESPPPVVRSLPTSRTHPIHENSPSKLDFVPLTPRYTALKRRVTENACPNSVAPELQTPHKKKKNIN
jgi:hypothetical protein